ncbi:MAG: hypothetical protein J6R89_05010, partial [Clostridia bacterium]|nr:hypothetical protein [Clostridia bacterium]
ERRKKYPFGVVCVSMALSGDTVERMVISGDFFGTRPVAELESLLVGHPLGALPDVDPAPYIAGMTKEAVVSLLLDQGT